MTADTILLRPVGGVLLPADQRAVDIVAKLEPDEPVSVRLLRHRSTRQNAFYWRMLEQAVEATGRWRTPQELHAALRIATGHVDEIVTMTGRRVLVPSSTAFDSMSHDEAQAYYTAAFDLLTQATGIEITRESH